MEIVEEAGWDAGVDGPLVFDVVGEGGREGSGGGQDEEDGPVDVFC